MGRKRKLEYVILTCNSCGKTFEREAYREKRKNFCNKLCRSKKNIILICSLCGKKFERMVVADFNASERNVFCGRKCLGSFWGSKNLEKPKSEFHKENIRSAKIGSHYNEDHRKNIGKGSAKRYEDPVYRERIRKRMIELGIHKDPSLLSEYQRYYERANWIERMYDRITDTVQLAKLKTLGVFNTQKISKNTSGVVRDHIYSRRAGFDNRVPPEILRHPSNCQLLTHGENMRKSKTNIVGRYYDNCDISLEELFSRIENFDQEWKEQERCLQLIEEYKNGKR